MKWLLIVAVISAGEHPNAFFKTPWKPKSFARKQLRKGGQMWSLLCLPGYSYFSPILPLDVAQPAHPSGRPCFSMQIDP
jgi:hypothetical protein